MGMYVNAVTQKPRNLEFEVWHTCPGKLENVHRGRFFLLTITSILLASSN
jgi:hypothetical protein